ncbi:sugar ABC transporter permease [soil metagenome]
MRRHTGLLFVLPALIVLGMLILYPMVYTAVLSVHDQDGTYIGLENYTRMVNSRQTNIAVWNTAYYVGASIFFQILFGTLVGILLNQKFRGRAIVRAMTLIPWVIPGIVAATVWAWMFHTEFGIINYMLTSAHVIEAPVSWLTARTTVMPALIAINVWKLFPFVAVMVLAGLQTVPAELYESARVDGATFWQEVWHVMIPSIRPVLTAITLLLLIWGLNAITIIYTITKGGPANRTLITPIQIFKTAFEAFQLNQAAALSVMFLAFTIVFVIIYIRTVAGTSQERGT